MVVQCHKCNKYFEDEYRTYVCPHKAFNANDGFNNFSINNDAYLSKHPPVSIKNK